MKLAVLSDLHANREAVQAVLAHARAQGADQHAFVGDLVGYGADPRWVVDTVRAMVREGALAVQGNHDAAVVRGAERRMRADARQVIDWTRAQLDAAQLDFLADLPLLQHSGELLFVHANAYDPPGWDYIVSTTEATLSLLATAQRITFCGHTHEPRLYEMSGSGVAEGGVPRPGQPLRLGRASRWLAIPGATGQPRDGEPSAGYALYDDGPGELSFWRVPYDVATASAKIHAARLPPALARRLSRGH